MTLIRPSPVENLFNTLWSLEQDRPKYYIAVCRVAQNIFKHMDKEYLVDELERQKQIYIEKPLKSPFVAVSTAFDKFRWTMPKRGYVKIGNDIDAREVTIFEIEQRLEAVKDWVYDVTSELSVNVRFVNQQPIMA